MFKAVPPNNTCAPLTNELPVTVRLNAPVANVVGFTLARTGVGFHSVTLLFPTALESAALTASISTVFGFGKLAGAVYAPEELIVPVLADPFATPFTSHVTFEFDEPATCAVKVWLAPARTFAEEGETETEIPGGGFPLFELDEELPQLIWDAARSKAMKRAGSRTRSPDGPLADQKERRN